MGTTATDNLETDLQRAHLHCVRREFDEAEALLKRLERRYPGNAEIRFMLGRIASSRRLDKEDSDKMRAWRYTLRLQTSWQRFVWGATGVLGIVYGVYGLLDRLPQCFHNGFGAVITTRIYRGSGRYSYRDPWVDWTRPLYYDIGYYGIMLAVGIVMILILRRVARGATQWEELDAPMPEQNRYGGW
jgi:hypothetical protein